MPVFSCLTNQPSARQESGALSWQDVENFGNKVLDDIQQVTPIITQAADIYNKVSGKGDKRETEHLMYVCASSKQGTVADLLTTALASRVALSAGKKSRTLVTKL